MLQGKGILTEAQRRILDCFRKLPDSSFFYLTGGTALAEFYLGHRRSFDLDLFTVERGLVLPFSRTLEDEFKREGLSVVVVRRFESSAEFEIGRPAESVRLHLAQDSPFRFEPPDESDIGIRVNDFKDLVVDKLLAFFGRVEPRDAIDLFFILKTEDLKELTRLALKKDPGFDLYWLVVALEKVKDFPDEIEKWPVDLIAPVEGVAIKNSFSSLALKIMEEIQGGGNP